MIPEYALVTIENELFFGPGISLITATHKTSLQSSRDNFEYAEPITIGDDCWFGANGTVIHGVAVDKAYTVGTGSIGTKDIPEYSVAVGVPARVVTLQSDWTPITLFEQEYFLSSLQSGCIKFVWPFRQLCHHGAIFARIHCHQNSPQKKLRITYREYKNGVRHVAENFSLYLSRPKLLASITYIVNEEISCIWFSDSLNIYVADIAAEEIKSFVYTFIWFSPWLEPDPNSSSPLAISAAGVAVGIAICLFENIEDFKFRRQIYSSHRYGVVTSGDRQPYAWWLDKYSRYFAWYLIVYRGASLK